MVTIAGDHQEGRRRPRGNEHETARRVPRQPHGERGLQARARSAAAENRAPAAEEDRAERHARALSIGATWVDHRISVTTIVAQTAATSTATIRPHPHPTPPAPARMTTDYRMQAVGICVVALRSAAMVPTSYRELVRFRKQGRTRSYGVAFSGDGSPELWVIAEGGAQPTRARRMVTFADGDDTGAFLQDVEIDLRRGGWSKV